MKKIADYLLNKGKLSFICWFPHLCICLSLCWEDTIGTISLARKLVFSWYNLVAKNEYTPHPASTFLPLAHLPFIQKKFLIETWNVWWKIIL